MAELFLNCCRTVVELLLKCYRIFVEIQAGSFAYIYKIKFQPYLTDMNTVCEHYVK